MQDPSQTLESLVALLHAQQKEARAQQKQSFEERKTLTNEIKRLVTMVEGLTLQLDKLLGDQHAEMREALRKKREDAQKVLEKAENNGPCFADEIPPASEAPSTPVEKNRDEHGRAPKPEHLNVDTTTIEPDKCPGCSGNELLALNTLESTEYDYVRPHFRIRKVIRKVCLCTKCRIRITPPQPPMPFDRVACTFSFMAWLCYSKAGLYLPLDRIRRDLEDRKVRIPSATLTRWWQRGADLLSPIANVVRLSLLTNTHIRTDGTGIRVVFPRKKGAPKVGEPRVGECDEDGYLLPQSPSNGQILIFGNDEHAVYHYTPSKHGHHSLSFLKIGENAEGTAIYWKGTITADASSTQDIFFEDGDRTEAGCNAHGIRKFKDDQEKAPLYAHQALVFIDKFYKIEANAKKQGLIGDALLVYRRKRGVRISEEFKDWLDKMDGFLLPSNPIQKAVKYYLNHWEALMRFLEDPFVELDNNWSERALRKVALFRNNSLYVGGEDGAVRLCTLLTLIQTSRELGVIAEDYLEWAMTRVVPHPDNRKIGAEDLTPAAYRTWLGTQM